MFSVLSFVKTSESWNFRELDSFQFVHVNLGPSQQAGKALQYFQKGPIFSNFVGVSIPFDRSRAEIGSLCIGLCQRAVLFGNDESFKYCFNKFRETLGYLAHFPLPFSSHARVIVIHRGVPNGPDSTSRFNSCLTVKTI